MDRRTLTSALWPLLLAVTLGCKPGGGDGGDDELGDGDTADTADTSDTSDTTGDGDGDGDANDPGRLTMHRLNNAEYDNTVRDLFFGMVEWKPASEFPADDHSYGFDNISDVQNLSPLQFELYERAADKLVEDALRVAPNPTLDAWEAESDEVSKTLGGAHGDGYWNLWSNGEVYATFTAGGEGTYRFAARAFAQQAGPELAHMALTIDNVVVYETDIAATDGNQAEVHEIELQLSAGVHKAAVVFTNDYYDEPNNADRNLIVDWFEVEGPLDPVPNPLRDLIVTCDPAGGEACLRQIIDEFVTRAWRRPLAPAEVDALIGLHQIVLAEGEGFEDSLRVILKAALISPHFLFRVERDEDPESLDPHLLNDFELASRLSYFLWSSMPDDELFDLAEAGELHDPVVLEQQVDRMLADPKAEALVDNFAGQWLYIRALDDVFKDSAGFPEFDDAMRESMRMEMRAFFRAFITEERPLTELLVGKTTTIDNNLALLYGVEPQGPGPWQLDMSELPRTGYLTTPGLMTVLSHPFTTSPVRRGKWVLDQLLCLPPPPPPPDIEIPPPDPNSGDTVREQLEQHRADPVCAACHDDIDPVGLSFEHYDAIGKFRTEEKGQPIDASGELPTSGEPFVDAVGMAALMVEGDEFPNCTVRKTFIYALGRGITVTDAPYLAAIQAEYALAQQRLPELIKLIVTSEPFRMRRGEPNE